MPKVKDKRVKYDIMMTEKCPLCEDEIKVGTAGLQGLAQHRGKKECLATVKRKQQDAAMVRVPTLFLYLRWKDTTLPTTADLVREAERKEYGMKMPPKLWSAKQQHLQQYQTSMQLIKARVRVRECEPGCQPRARSTTPNINTQNNVWHEARNARRVVPRHELEPQERLQATTAQNGCGEAWFLLDSLHAEIGSVHKALETGEGNELTGYNRIAALSICADIPQDELWENVNPGLDRILGFGRLQEDIVEMIRHGWEGLQGLDEYLEVLIKKGGMVVGLLEGKVTVLMTAMAV
ncbi:hypothetical protein EI94DRAFT_1706270 [Lactarius quietus]|nr:hypothetical protein EI94DRAFT_1706270 [Lactarius quietus]